MQKIERKPAALIFWWMAVVVLFWLANLNVKYLVSLYSVPWIQYAADHFSFDTKQLFLQNIVSPIRGMALLFSLGILTWSFPGGLNKSNSNIPVVDYRVEFLKSLGLFLVLCVLVIPTGLYGLSNEYSNTSTVLYDRLSAVSFRQRFLMPAVANLLFFRGDLFYFLFALICAFLLVFSLRLWFLKNNVRISFLNLVSAATLGFVCFQLSNPGYPDVLVFIFILLAFSLDLTLYAKLSLFVLSLASHEASLIIWSALAFSLFNDRKGFLSFLAVAIIYVMFLLWGENGITGILANRQVAGISNLDWVLKNPRREWIGILLAFRACWLIVLGALAVLWREKEFTRAAKILVIIMAGFAMTFLGVDTTRLVGWAFMAVLLAWQVLDRQADKRWQGFVNAVMLVNLLIPPYFIQLNLNAYVPRGLYAYILEALTRFLSG